MGNLEKIGTVLSGTLEKYPAAFAYVFGSAATGHTHKDSDLDIAVGFSHPITDEVFYALFNELYPRLVGLRPEKLDLKNFSELPLAVRFRVIRDGKLLYLKNQRVHRDMAVKTLDYYHDYYPVMEKLSQLFFKRAAAQ